MLEYVKYIHNNVNSSMRHKPYVQKTLWVRTYERPYVRPLRKGLDSAKLTSCVTVFGTSISRCPEKKTDIGHLTSGPGHENVREQKMTGKKEP